jgi:Flp pilus assembly pilin Flp
MNLITKFFKDEDGAELAEYAVACAILVAVAIIVLQVLGNAIIDRMNDVADEVAPPSSEAGP